MCRCMSDRGMLNSLLVVVLGSSGGSSERLGSSELGLLGLVLRLYVQASEDRSTLDSETRASERAREGPTLASP
jgi:hypothetical protein